MAKWRDGLRTAEERRNCQKEKNGGIAGIAIYLQYHIIYGTPTDCKMAGIATYLTHYIQRKRYQPERFMVCTQGWPDRPTYLPLRHL